MTETKRDVFEDLVEELANAYIALDGEGIGEDLTNEDKQVYLKDYDNALPDDLPVIPKRVSKIIRITKSVKMNISQALIYIRSEFNSYTDWSLSDNNSETFARAWLLGVWRVKETGEIVKLEEEK
ncbi:DUF1642 domain-containing protein [Lacticaseibacillus paracasei]|uniref:DUF1642 domain-containing protein n=1 Tax=Lacticaseibacillus paracasei TaxID=1597 RepID=UPI001E49A190|nr:DUF1642 domain-containing protein [Lacticaseibacillus paracasei]WPQ31754.1 DUF1642 domain-containing protein [Lacticaseibacillus paracasei]